MGHLQTFHWMHSTSPPLSRVGRIPSNGCFSVSLLTIIIIKKDPCAWPYQYPTLMEVLNIYIFFIDSDWNHCLAMCKETWLKQQRYSCHVHKNITCPLCCILASKTNKKVFPTKTEDQLGLKVTEKHYQIAHQIFPSMLTSCGIEIEPSLHSRSRKKQKQLREGKDLNKESEAGKKEVGIKLTNFCCFFWL